MATGWQNIEGNLYYFKATGGYGLRGRMFTGVQNINSRTFYFNSSGVMQIGWHNIS